ncbi:MAG: Stp1/IreP family PP2C-type Ser/Thr phosphatase [Anaerovoracaceae bacterium]
MTEVGYKTHSGKIRSNNEDSYLVMRTKGVYMVADGVGGNNGGEKASKMAVDIVSEYISKNNLDQLNKKEEIGWLFKRAIDEANLQIREKAKSNSEYHGMATTLVVAYILGKTLFVINIGDSRAYICRDEEIYQITEDHTYVNSLVKQGAITKEEARDHEENHMITKAVGAEPTADMDFFKIGIEKDDVILLCTDGLYGEIQDDVILKNIIEEKNMTKLANKLIEIANEAGGKDNVTAVCITVKGGNQNE